MSERKPQGKWTKREDETFWRLSTHPHSYKILPGSGGFWVMEFDADGIDRSRDDFEEPFATLEAAQIAAEDDVRRRAESDLRTIGLPPLGEVIESAIQQGPEPRGNNELSVGFAIASECLFQAYRIFWNEDRERETRRSGAYDTADAAVRAVAAKLGEGRP